MIESNHVVLWNRCLDVIKDNVPETTYNTWFAPIVPLKYEDKTLILQIPSQFFYEILEERFVDLIRKTLYKVIGEGTKLMYNVMVDKTSIPNQTVNLEASNRSTAVTPKSIIGGNKAPSFLQAPAVQDLDPHLNPNYNFENFIEGYSNKLSRSVAEAVAQKPGGTAFNPLFLYGASGVNCSLFGIGERTGNTPLEAMVFEYAQLRGTLDGMDTRVITELADYYEKEIGYKVPSRTPFVGKNFNVTRAGIHADGMLKNEEIYNIFDTDKFLGRPALVSVSNTSGVAGIAYWINAYYKLPKERQVDKTSMLVTTLKSWVDKQYEEGRVTVLTDEELVDKIDSICEKLHVIL